MSSTHTKQGYGYLFVVALFLLLCAPTLFSKGMFLDGVIYASVARNMAQGIGSFWQPVYTQTLFNPFFEHPPLALGVQSTWFWLFGDSFLVERFYALAAFFVSGFVLVSIWKQLTNGNTMGWIPLLLWVAVPITSWACANNMLENTMMIFTNLAVLFYLKSTQKKRVLFLLLAGLALSLAFLSKGFFALYIWSAPFFFWLVLQRKSFVHMCVNTVLLCAFTLLPLWLCTGLSPDAAFNLESYFNKQVVNSIQHVQTVSSRFAILGNFASGILPALLLGGVLLLITRLRGIALREMQAAYKKPALALLLLSLSGVLPIMVSLKQRGFYILSVYPFFALALGLLLLPLFSALLSTWGAKAHSLFRYGTFAFLATAICLSVYFAGSIGRDREKIRDTQAIISFTGEGKTIGVCPELSREWSLHAYFQRYGQVSLARKHPHTYKYLVQAPECAHTKKLSPYTATGLNLEHYRLYIRTKR